MGRHILFALLSGFLMLGMSNAFAEEPQLSDQEILKAWGSAQIEVNQMPAPMGKQGLQVLTDDDLDGVTAAGAWGLLTNTGCGVLCWQKTFRTDNTVATKCFGAIANCAVIR